MNKEKKENLLRDDLIISNGEISIDPELWEKIKKHYDQKEIISFLDRMIDNHKIQFPYKKISKAKAIKDFQALEVFDINTLTSFQKWNCHRTKINPMMYKKKSVVINQSNVGLYSSDYFHQLERAKAWHERYISPYEAWNTSGKRYFLKTLFLINKQVNQSILRRCLQLKQYWASQFRPSAAKWIYEMFKAKDVLDFSMGWGDRLSGFHASSCTRSYIGIDPNSSLHPAYISQNLLYDKGKSTQFICLPAEDVNYSKFLVDLVFTSPPYFTQERYCNEPTQSWIKYGNNLDNWLEGFLFPTLRGCWSCLREWGRILINISDFYTREGHLQVCQPMLEFMESIGANYEGVIGYKMTKRVASSNWYDNNNSVYCEPIWIWAKGNAPKPIFKSANSHMIDNNS